MKHRRQQRVRPQGWKHLSGEQFDRQYLKANSTANDQAIAPFEAEVAEGDDPDVVACAELLLPALSDHRAHADALLAQVATGDDNGDDDGNSDDDDLDDGDASLPFDTQ